MFTSKQSLGVLLRILSLLDCLSGIEHIQRKSPRKSVIVHYKFYSFYKSIAIFVEIRKKIENNAEFTAEAVVEFHIPNLRHCVN